MNNKQLYALIAVLLVVFWTGVVTIVWRVSHPAPVKYDCTLAEFHPDMPLDVRKECRKVRT